MPQNDGAKTKTVSFQILGMLCVWDKKKLELQERQQLGGGGAQSIKVGLFEFLQPFSPLAVWYGIVGHNGVANHTSIFFLGMVGHHRVTDHPVPQVLTDRLLVAVSEYILVLDHSCQVTQAAGNHPCLVQEVIRLKQYGSGALSCVASDGHWVVAGAARHGLEISFRSKIIFCQGTSCLGSAFW